MPDEIRGSGEGCGYEGSKVKAPETDSKTIELPSGRKLMISTAPFRVAEALNDAIMEECEEFQRSLDGDIDIKALLSRVILKGFSSKKIKAAIWACMPKVLLDKQHITEETFEPVATRGDYYIVCYHVAEVNVAPFMKDLTSQFAEVTTKLAALVLASRSKTTV
jgi:hypothetical protein